MAVLGGRRLSSAFDYCNYVDDADAHQSGCAREAARPVVSTQGNIFRGENNRRRFRAEFQRNFTRLTNLREVFQCD